uniref:Reverse transcriptase/retrotransposon-derived protein RNase H-like domain-containing protein n=1 Tax=Oreochromis niloticus TaxID=8128 RepID=A0A669DR80_ORENI
MDIVGPLVKSSSGHQYILVVCDYATRFPEAFPLRAMDKVEAIQKCPRPRTKKEVRSFLGLVGWYRRFVPQFATIAGPLTALTSKHQRNPVTWTTECENVCNMLKTYLCRTPVLRSLDFSKKFMVQVNASTIGLGAVLARGDPGEEYLVLYLSQKLVPRETNYSTVEKEALAIKWELMKLRYYLLGREFELETDHRAFTWIHSMKDHNTDGKPRKKSVCERKDGGITLMPSGRGNGI